MKLMMNCALDASNDYSYGVRGFLYKISCIFNMVHYILDL